MKKTFIYGILNIIILFLLNVIFLIGLYLTNTNIKLTIIITLTLLLINIVACKSYISKSKILYNTSQFIFFIISIGNHIIKKRPAVICKVIICLK